MATFTLRPDADIGGTSRIGTMDLAALALVRRFGRPAKCDGYKVSGEYRFVDGEGRVYTVYDWKETTLYADDPEEEVNGGVPRPEEFWKRENPVEFQIGGREGSDVGAFKRWLLEAMG